MRIPQAYPTQGDIRLTANTPPYGWSQAPDTISPAGQSLAHSLNQLSHSMYQQEISTELLRREKLDADFKLKMVKANEELDQATSYAPRLTQIDDSGQWTDKPATDEEQQSALKATQSSIRDELFRDAPGFAQQKYLAAFEQQITNSNKELVKAQEMKHQADAMAGNIDIIFGMSASANQWLANFDPKTDKNGEVDDPADVLKQYKEENDQILKQRYAEMSQKIGPAAARQTMAPLISTARQQYLNLQNGLTKALHESAKADVDLTIQQIRSLPVSADAKMQQIGGVLQEMWSATGQGQDDLVKEYGKQYQSVYKLEMEQGLNSNMHSIGGLKAYIKYWSATGKDKEGQPRYLAAPDLDEHVREGLLKEAHNKLDAAIKHQQSEGNKWASQEYSLALKVVQDAMQNNEMPDTATLSRLAAQSRTPMQKLVLNNISSKLNSLAWQAGAMAKDPYLFSVSSRVQDPQMRNMLLQPLNVQNGAAQIAARIGFATQAGVPPITATEARSLAALGDQSLERAVSVVETLTKNLPPNIKDRTRGYIGEQTGHKNPVLGNYLAVVTVDSGIAANYRTGAELLKQKALDPEIQKDINNLKSSFAKQFSGTGLNHYTKDYSRAQDIFVGAMLGARSSGHEVDGEEVMNKLVGEVVRTGSGRFGRWANTIVPDGLDTTKVQNFSRYDRPDMARELGANSTSDLRNPLIWTPHGGYKLIKDNEYIKNKNGSDLIVPFEYFR